MHKKIYAALLCALLIFQMAAPPVKAADYVYFVAAGENILPMSDRNMPFWSGGYLYVSCDVFTGIGRKSLDIGRSRKNEEKQLVLYSGSKSLWFKWETDYSYDLNGNIYLPGAVYRNGQVFVPAAVVAQYFGLQYSVAKVNSWAAGKPIQGDLVWLRQSGSGLPATAFADAASAPIADCYLEYIRGKEVKEEPAETGSSEIKEPDLVEMGSKRIYLCAKAGENTAALLNELDRYGAQAAFFCTPEFLQTQGDLLRRMMATGQAIGILADGANEQVSVEQQLQQGNQALEAATWGKTRLVLVEHADEELLQTVSDAGYCCLQPDLDRSGYHLRSTSNAAALLKSVSAQRRDVSVWLADAVNVTGLRAFLKASASEKDHCLAWNENV